MMENNCVLTVTPDGQFVWADNADELIESGDFSASPAMPHILRRLREVEKYRAVMQQAAEVLENGQPVNYWENGAGERSPVYRHDPLHEANVTKALTALRDALKEGA